MADGIHTCSYHCLRPPCVLAQRNELRDRLEAAERERNAERAVAIGHLSQVNALRAERDALATLLQRAFAALTEWHCEHGTVPESDAVLLHDIRCEIDIDAALAAKGQSNG
jgi:hypothetical protein